LNIIVETYSQNAESEEAAVEFLVDRDQFSSAVMDVNNVVSPKAAFHILTGIKIVADVRGVTLIGSNADIVIQRLIPFQKNGVKVLEISSFGTVVIPAKYISEIVKKMPGDIRIVNRESTIEIASGEIMMKLNGFHDGEYPGLPAIINSKKTLIQASELIKAIKQTVFAVSTAESRPILTGVHFTFEENLLTFTATDTHRLALRKIKIASDLKASCVVPSTSLKELVRLANNETGHIEILFVENYIIFNFGSVTLFSRVIAGKYPELTNIMPNNPKTIITLNRKKFLQGVDRAGLFARDWQNNNIKLDIINETKIKISSESSQAGKISEMQDITTCRGNAVLNISFDGSFMKEALRVVDDEEIKLSFEGSMRPIVIESTNSQSAIQLISPVRA
jgi:DNA polymerase III subunit beta